MSYVTSFCHRTLPSARARQSRLRIVPSLLPFGSTFPFSSFFGFESLFAWVRKILSPQTIGVEYPGNSRGTFHFTFSLLLHLSGRFFSEECPCPVGPRHAGQFSPRAAVTSVRPKSIEQTASRRREGMAEGSGRENWRVKRLYRT